MLSVELSFNYTSLLSKNNVKVLFLRSPFIDLALRQDNHKFKENRVRESMITISTLIYAENSKIYAIKYQKWQQFKKVEIIGKKIANFQLFFHHCISVVIYNTIKVDIADIWLKVIKPARIPIIILMSKQKYIQETLTLPSQLPLFNYNINFEGLRKILEDVNIKTNNNEQDIKKLQESLNNKLPTANLLQTEKKLNSSYLFGTKCQNYIDQQEEKVFKVNKIIVQQLTEIDQFCWKMNKMAEILEYLYDKSQTHDEKIGSDNKRNQKLIDQSFRRLEDKITNNLETVNKTINSYFTQTNEKVSDINSNLNTLKLNTESKMKDLNADLSKKMSETTIKAALEGSQTKVKQELQSVLKNDQMQRLSVINQIKGSFKEAEKDLDLKNKALAMKMQQLSDKVNKSLLTSTFDIEKHKIYERLSELKSRADELHRKSNDFVEFRKTYLTNNEKNKQQIIGLNDEIKKLNQKETSFKKLESMSDTLNSLNPHLICEIGEEVKLHQKEIGKLQKQFIELQNSIRAKAHEKPVPEVNSGQNSDLIQKIIKEFMSNMDFEGRAKRSEREIQELKKRNDTLPELQKKIYLLSKEIDMGAITKELKKKCDEENTRKDTKILDGKIEQLFEFYKQLRREIEQKKKGVSKNEPFDNASLTTKRLLSANCLSCNPSTPSTRRMYSKNKLQMSLDYGIQSQKNTVYSRMGK